nr:uncharacterized protein LOC122271709 [Parasteatoda tepidariorum]
MNSFENGFKKSPRQRHLETQAGFLQEVLSIKDKYNLFIETEILPTPCSPLDYQTFNVATDLALRVLKSDFACDVLKGTSYATMNELYPEPEWLRILTDGSRVDQRVSAGAGVFCHLFSAYASFGYYASAYDGVIEAILIA